MSDGESDKVHLTPIVSQKRDEEELLFRIFYDLIVAFQVSAEPDLHDEEGAHHPIE